jgi:hypothetical protein
MPIPLAIPIVGGLVVATGTVLALRARKKKEKSAAAVTFSPRQQQVIAQPLAPAAQQAVAGPGPAPSQAAVNSLKIMLDAGTIKLDEVMKSTTGQIVSKTPPPGNVGGVAPPDAILSQIRQGDTLTVQTAFANLPAFSQAGLAIMPFVAQGPVDMGSRVVMGISSDPRVPPTQEVFPIPVGSITGIGPAD